MMTVTVWQQNNIRKRKLVSSVSIVIDNLARILIQGTN